MVVGATSDKFESVFASLHGEDKRKAEGDAGADGSKKQRCIEQGDREEIRVYETMPSQMLNAYGMAAFAQMERKKVWEDLNKPLKTGAKYMSEYCSNKQDRRCVACNRALQPLSGVSQIPADGYCQGSEQVHPAGGDLQAAVCGD